MAIKAAEAMTAVLEIDEQHLQQVEELIDREILRQVAAGEEIYIGLPNVSKRIAAELVRRYEHAGWHVTYHRATEQRDNDSLKLRAVET
jgi:hypothetical protein